MAVSGLEDADDVAIWFSVYNLMGTAVKVHIWFHSSFLFGLLERGNTK